LRLPKGRVCDTREGKRGLYQAARGGTVFLDEVGEMSLKLQAKLLMQGKVYAEERSYHEKLDLKTPFCLARRVTTDCVLGTFTRRIAECKLA
jgi:sigma54-dependent transcription regulator